MPQVLGDEVVSTQEREPGFHPESSEMRLVSTVDFGDISSPRVQFPIIHTG